VDGSHIRTLLLTFFFRHMNELITRGHVFIAQPPLYRIKKGKSEKYIKDEKEFTREVIRRATDDLRVEFGTPNGKPVQSVDGADLRNFLLALDEFHTILQKVERRVRDGRVAEILADVALAIDTKQDFTEQAHLQAVLERLKPLDISAALARDEAHSAWMVTYKDPTGGERRIDTTLVAAPEFRRLRTLARQMLRFNIPPFTVVKGADRQPHATTHDLLAYIKNEGRKDASVQRYKGLGEMNAEQLWDTTMNAETRTLLQVRLDDAVACENIFSTLMGENVEARRKFIEENALYVKNLDV